MGSKTPSSSIAVGYSDIRDLSIFVKVTDPNFFRSAKFFVAGNYGPVETVARVDFTTQSRANLDLSDAAVLYLLDTCYAAGAAVDGNREVFAAAAAGIELPTDSSWTKEVCRHLRNANGKPMTVAQLHGRMMQSLADGRLPVTPVHSELAPSAEGSIVLAPVSVNGLLLNPYGIETSREEDTRGQPMVLISVQLKDMTGPPSIEPFKTWLLAHQASIIHSGSVKIEVSGCHTFFSGFSGVLLLTLPVSVWVCLRADPAYSFVRFVTSDNEYLAGRPLTLAERP